MRERAGVCSLAGRRVSLIVYPDAIPKIMWLYKKVADTLGSIQTTTLAFIYNECGTGVSYRGESLAY